MPSMLSFGLVIVSVVSHNLCVVDALQLQPTPSSSSLADSSSTVSRRDLFHQATVAAASAGALLISPQLALGKNASQQQAPIAILGANGRTGTLCVTACLSRGIPVRALTRSGAWNPPLLGSNSNEDESSLLSNNPLLTVSACDVKDPQALANGLRGCQAVVYAASASKQGGNAKAIDNDAVVAAGNVCLAENIGRYVVISSTATTRPNSLGYKFTNVFGGIMEQKRLGEEGVQLAYQKADTAAGSGPSYSILRPGGLEEPKKNEILGPKSLEISQGDVLAGIVSRADLAELTIEIAASNAPNLRNTALEVFYADSTQPCGREFKSFMTNGVVPRLRGYDTYVALLEGVQPAVDYYVPS